MVSHIVLFRLRQDLSPADRDALVAALELALQSIPSIRAFRVGRRVRFGATYEPAVPDLPLTAVIDFDDLAGLKTYLDHPAHADVGARFNASVELALVWDFEMMEAEKTRMLLDNFRLEG